MMGFINHKVVEATTIAVRRSMSTSRHVRMDIRYYLFIYCKRLLRDEKAKRY